MTHVTAYIRISTDKQTLDNQRSEILRFAQGHGLEIDNWIEEIVSGKVKERDLISARTREALAVRKEQGAVLGRQPGSCPKMGKLMVEKEEILRRRNAGMSITDLSKAYNVSRGTMSKFIGSHV